MKFGFLLIVLVSQINPDKAVWLNSPILFLN